MRKYQKALLESLERYHWQLDERLTPEEWWAAEVWIISSTRQRHGLQLFVTFLVDPQSGASDLASVSEIAITRARLADWPATESVTLLQPSRRSYPAEVDAAMLRLDAFRDDAEKLG